MGALRRNGVVFGGAAATEPAPRMTVINKLILLIFFIMVFVIVYPHSSFPNEFDGCLCQCVTYQKIAFGVSEPVVAVADVR